MVELEVESILKPQMLACGVVPLLAQKRGMRESKVDMESYVNHFRIAAS